MEEVVLARTSLTLHPHPLPLCCNYPVLKCPSASIVVTSTLRVERVSAQFLGSVGYEMWNLKQSLLNVLKLEGSNEYRLPVWHLIQILWVIIEGRDNVRCSAVRMRQTSNTMRSKYSSLSLCWRDKRIIIVSRLIEIPSINFQRLVNLGYWSDIIMCSLFRVTRHHNNKSLRLLYEPVPKRSLWTIYEPFLVA